MAGAAIVTGGSGGMGVGTCERPAEEGFPVVVHYSGSAEKAEEVVEKIKSAGGHAISMAADISKADEVKSLFARAMTTFGTIEVVVHTAGIMPLGPIAKGDMESFDKVLRRTFEELFL